MFQLTNVVVFLLSILGFIWLIAVPFLTLIVYIISLILTIVKRKIKKVFIPFLILTILSAISLVNYLLMYATIIFSIITNLVNNFSI